MNCLNLDRFDSSRLAMYLPSNRLMPKAVRLLIGLHLALGLLYSWATPILEASDEAAHYAVVNWLAQGNALPIQNPQGPHRPWEQEGSQPPLYYALAAGLTFWIDTSDFNEVYVRNPLSQVGIPGTTHNVNLFRHPLTGQALTGTALAIHLTRWFSLTLSCLTILLTFWLARQIYPDHEAVALVASALVAFNPMALFINASVNNDNLLMLLSTASLLMMIHLMPAAVKRFEWKALGLGALLGLAALTKISGLVLWPMAALAVGWGAWRARSWRKFIVGGVIIGATALLLSGWWYWRNQLLYGEVLGLETMVAIAGPRVPPITLFNLFRDEWYGFYRSYWGVFGVFTVLPASWMQRVFDVLTLWALAGGLVLLARRRFRLAKQWPRTETLLLLVFCALTFIGLIRWTLTTFASQGRLMFGAIAPLSIFMAVGLLAPFASRHLESWKLSMGVFVLACLAALIPIADIAPRYAPPGLLAEANLPANLKTVRATFGNVLELIGYTSEDTPRLPSESQPVTLYWRVLQPMSHDYALALHLLGRGQTTEVGKIDTWPGGGLAPTSQLPVGAIFADPVILPIAPSAETPSLLWLAVDVWEAAPNNQLPITTASGPTDSVVLRVGRIIPAQPLSVAPTHAVPIAFEYGITLLGIDPGPDGAFTLYWQTTQSIPGDYTVFAHLLDASGTQVTQKDGPPLNGDWPTSAWVVNQPFADPRQFDVAGLRPGQYTVRLGFYEPASGVRLAAFQPDGARWPDDMVLIEDVIEIK